MKSRPKTSWVGDAEIWTRYSKSERLWVTVITKPEDTHRAFDVGTFYTFTSRKEASWEHYFQRTMVDAMYCTPDNSYPARIAASYLNRPHRRRRRSRR